MTSSRFPAYISMMALKCGLDERFLAAFATKMATKSRMERRGMLLLDEIQVGKELAANSKTLTYSGLVDHGQDDGDCTELANRGLVFAFAPFADSYLQPVAVFASKGPTKGTRLLLQCILKLEQAGIHTDGVVSDGATTNRSMWKHLGVTVVVFWDVSPTFPSTHPTVPDEFTYSPMHRNLFKCIRNRLHSEKGFHIKGRCVRWSCYDALCAADTQVMKGYARRSRTIQSTHIHVEDGGEAGNADI